MLHDEKGVGFGTVASIRFDNSYGFDTGLASKCGLEVFGINIETAGGDDDIFLAATEVEVAIGVDGSEISGGEPLGFLMLHLAVLPGGIGDGFAAHKDFAFIAETDLSAGQDLADGSFRCAERVIEADEGGGLRHAIALNDDETETAPELFADGG